MFKECLGTLVNKTRYINILLVIIVAKWLFDLVHQVEALGRHSGPSINLFKSSYSDLFSICI